MNIQKISTFFKKISRFLEKVFMNIFVAENWIFFKIHSMISKKYPNS